MSSTAQGTAWGTGIRLMSRVTLAGSAVAATFSVMRDAPPAGRRLDRPGSSRRAPRQELPSTERGKVLLVSTQGGHLAQLLALHRWYADLDRTWVCPDTPDVADRLADERVIHSFTPTTRNIPNLIRNLVLAVTAMRRERPSVVVSAGAGVAVPFFVVAWLMRVPTAFIEVVDRIDSPTMTGRLCGPFSTRRIVQWKSQQEFYPQSQLVGPLL